MATQGERQDFKWRPNDYSSTTLARYDQEAEHWYKAFKNAERKNRPSDYRGAFNTIGLIISLVISMITLMVLSAIQLIKWIRS